MSTIRNTLTGTLRATRLARAPLNASLVGSARGIATSPLCRKSEGEGIGKKEPVGGDNPVSARLKGVGSAAKSMAEGVAGTAEAAAGKPESERTYTAGPDSRDVQTQEKDKGKQEGLAKKGEAQGGEQ